MTRETTIRTDFALIKSIKIFFISITDSEGFG
jgi:hypothetical protein